MSRLLSTTFFMTLWLCPDAKTACPDLSEQVDGVAIHQTPVCSPSKKKELTSFSDVYIVIT